MASHNKGTDRAERAAVYREAAALLFKPTQREAWGCCDVINTISVGNPTFDSPEKELFEEYFMPSTQRIYWGELWSDGDGCFGRSVHSCRVLALCFMAAMVEAGDA